MLFCVPPTPLVPAVPARWLLLQPLLNAFLAASDLPCLPAVLCIILLAFFLPACCPCLFSVHEHVVGTGEGFAIQPQNLVLAAASEAELTPSSTPQNVTSSPSAKFEAALTWILSSNKDVGIW